MDIETGIEILLEKKEFGNSTYFKVPHQTFKLLQLDEFSAIKVILVKKIK